ncbi:ATP-grasp domain-containing protein [Rhodocytophaga rosea]|uniref:ATP-grasp domain-containing protein n=1 Tax=Rhodocytophaga rosea TaxID=2704465 RepID=A0A6C0GSG5_9BACT|nr:ATP-grasp domain-containing protein [Rhodocytophaga rosea]QHT71039.1 ATP-grasp domain-containing protein [Rhodocytophaga rosea]
MNLSLNKTLLIPEKSDIERDTVASTFQRLGGSVMRLGKFWEKPANFEGKQIAIYGNDTFAKVVAQVFEVQLISPDDSFIARLSQQWLKRLVTIKTIAQLTENDFSRFVKLVLPKQFKANVYKNRSYLATEITGLNTDTEVLLSEIIEINAEARAFIWDGRLADLALYEGSADLEEGRKFLTDFINNHPDLPKVLVADIAYTIENGWFILEFNACWGAGLNGCDPEKVLACILEATQN